MLSKNLFYFSLVVLFVQAAAAQTLLLDAKGYIRSSEGGYGIYDYEGALQACPAGTHLPTARELAEEAQRHGAKGLLEITKSNRHSAPQGYEKISTVELNGESDEFYYNHEGYRPYLETAFFWSSSETAAPYTQSYGMFGDKGEIAMTRQEGVLTHVRCFPNL